MKFQSDRLRRVGPSMVLAAAMLLASEVARGQGAGVNPYACGPLNPPGQYGPFDRRNITEEMRHRVEDYHFTLPVQLGIGGVSGTYGGDIDYTLRVFPNNARALMSIERYSLSHHTERAQGAKYVTECYFERALRFMPSDPMVHLTYAIYLKNRNRVAEAGSRLDEAERLRGDMANFDFDYNLGLLYFELGAYDKSLVAAKRAYALGAPLPALEKKLRAAGKWRDDPPPPAPAAAPPVEQGPATSATTEEPAPKSP